MSNIRMIGRNLLAKGKSIVALGVVSAGTVAGSAFAQSSGGIDTSGVTTTIGLGLTAAGVIGVAWLSFKYLQKVYNRI